MANNTPATGTIGGNPGVVVYPWLIETHAQAVAQEAANQARLAVNATGNLITLHGSPA